MELRSSRTRRDSTEYMELQTALNALGFYEANMELQEMRQLMTALQASMYEKESTNVQTQDIELALKESELDFVSPNGVYNSTMITPMDMNDTDLATLLPNNNFYLRCSSSPFSSPEKRPVKVLAEAEIHHENDWSPPSVRLRPPTPRALDLRVHRKRQAIRLETIADTTEESSFDGHAKRIRMQESSTNLTPDEQQLTDSGVGSNFSSSRSTTNDSLGESSAGFSNEEMNSQVDTMDDRNVVHDYSYNYNVAHNGDDCDDDDSL